MTIKGLNRKRYEVKVIAGSFRRDEHAFKGVTPKRTINCDTSCCSFFSKQSGEFKPTFDALPNGAATIPQMKRVLNPFLDILTLFKLYCNIKRERPVIVHTHTSKAGFLGRWAAKLAGVPIIIHTPHGHIFYGYFPWLVTRFFILLEKFTGFITDYIITLTERGKEEYVRYRIGPPAKYIIS